MSEQEFWEEIRHLEEEMNTMHVSLDKIIAGCKRDDALSIRSEAEWMRKEIATAFIAKFSLIDAIRRYFQ